MRGSVAKATAALADLATKPSFTEVRVRKDFVYQVDAPPGDWSDRRLPPRELRPPAAQLVSPRGASLRLFLTGLFEAQARGRQGTHPANPRPLRAAGSGQSWVDLLASDARPAMSGRIFMNVADKKLRQLRNTLDRLVGADLIALPNAHLRGLKRYENFRLQNEAGTRRNGPNIKYELPKSTDVDIFSLPVDFFTKGWIHVLEDTEILFILMLAHYAAKTSDGGIRIDSETRLLHHGIGRDAYEAHFMLDWLNLVYVSPDPLRKAKGRIEGFTTGSQPLPHALRLLPEGFTAEAMPRVEAEIEYQLSRA